MLGCAQNVLHTTKVRAHPHILRGNSVINLVPRSPTSRFYVTAVEKN